MTTPRPPHTNGAWPAPGFLDRRRYRTIDRDRLFLDPDDAPVTRPHTSYCVKGTS